MHGGRMPKMTLKARMERRRRRGRPRKRWLDDIEHDLQQLGVGNWRLKWELEMEAEVGVGNWRLKWELETGG
jgi:hypothetical protein